MTTTPGSHAFSVAIVNDSARVAIAGKLEATNRDLFKSMFDIPLAAGASAFVIDFSACTGVDTHGIGALITCARRVRSNGGTFRVDGLDEDLRRLFAETQLDQYIDGMSGPVSHG